MSQIVPISELVDQLPEKNITTMALTALDFVVPGEWVNDTSFDGMIRRLTEADDADSVAAIRERAVALYLDPANNYQKAMKVFSLVDTVDKVAAATAMASKVAQKVSFLSFLDKFTPKADTTQSIDAALKLVAEVTAFMLLNGMPRGGVSDFVNGLKEYGKADLMRLAAWVAIDGLIPLGPDFMQKIISGVDQMSSNDLGGNKLYDAISKYVPGDSAADKQSFVKNAIGSSATWITGFVEDKGLTQDLVVNKIKGIVDVADSGLDYLAAALDASTSYFEHTGTQTVARFVIMRAYNEMMAEYEGAAAAAAALALANAEAAAAAGDDDEDDDRGPRRRSSGGGDEDKRRMRAFLAAAAIGALADGEYVEGEDVAMVRALGGLPIFQGRSEEQIEGLVSKGIDFVSSKGVKDAMDWVARALPEEEDRQTALALAAAIVFVDEEVTNKEDKRIWNFAETLGLDEDTTSAILENIEAQMMNVEDGWEDDDEDEWGDDGW